MPVFLSFNLRFLRQYGRTDGGSAEFKGDVINNLTKFRKLVDYGLTSGIPGTFSGRGFAVIEVSHVPDPNDSESIQHQLHW